MATQIIFSNDVTGTQFIINDAVPVAVSNSNKFDFTVDSNTAGNTTYPYTGVDGRIAGLASPGPSFYRNGVRQPFSAFTYDENGSITLADGSKFVLNEILSFAP